MLRQLRPRSVYDVMAAIACFAALAGGTAYAANTIGTGDIIDDQVTSADVRDDNLGFGGLAAQDLAPGSVGTSEVANSSLAGTDIQNGSLTSLDIASSTLNGDDVINNSLTGDDINESTLNLPQTPTTATFAGPPGPVTLQNAEAFTKVVGKTLPAGSYAVAATANYSSGTAAASAQRDIVCELRNGSGFIGGATDRREFQTSQVVKSTLSMNGGAQVPAGGEVSLWCRVQNASGSIDYAQMMIIRLDGFF